MSDGIKVDFAEIDRMSTAITNLNSFAAPLVPKIGALSVDGDLLASAILSPGTAAAAEGAVISASAQLGLTVVSTEALVLITASVSKVYQAAEVGLALAVPAVEHVGDQALLAAGGLGTVSLMTAMLGVAAAAATVADGVPAVVESLWDAVGERSTWTAPGAFGVNVARAFASNFSPSDFSSTTVSVFQGTLGARGDVGYALLLSLLVHQGRGAGLFNDGTATSTPSELGNTVAKQNDLDTLAEKIYGRPQYAQGEDMKGATPFEVDQRGNVKPRNLSELWAGAGQIDNIGAKEYGNLRVIRTESEDGPRFVVQIPSTQVWDPKAGPVPNDLTSDVLAMRYGDSTALANVVRKQLMDIPEIRDGQAPVMLTGFSLGGITAGAIAADPGKLNVQQVVTAGAPIGRMDIPPDITVTSFEAREDPIARLDGAQNPSRPGWMTVGGPAPAFSGGRGEQTFVSAHDAARYAIMAKQDPALNNESAAAQFLDGEQTVVDYRLERDH